MNCRIVKTAVVLAVMVTVTAAVNLHSMPPLRPDVPVVTATGR